METRLDLHSSLLKPALESLVISDCCVQRGSPMQCLTNSITQLTDANVYVGNKVSILISCYSVVAVTVEQYSVVYFDRITAFDVLLIVPNFHYGWG